MKQVIAALLVFMVLNCQETNRVIAAPIIATPAPAPVNNANASVNSKNAVKVDNNFLLELLALKEIAVDNQKKGVLAQLLTLDTLWNTNSNLKNLFQNVNFGAANVGIYYDYASQSFKMVDMTTRADVTIADFVAKLQAMASANNSVPVKSGLADLDLGLNLLNLIDLNAGLSLLSGSDNGGLLDLGADLNVLNLVDAGVGVSVLSGNQDGGLLDLGADLNVLNLVDAGVGVSVLSGSQDGGLLDLGAGVNVLDIVDANAGVSVLSGGDGGILGLDLGLNVLGLLNLDTSLNVG